MADVLRDGLAWLTQQLGSWASVPVTYARGGDSVSDVHATLGKKLLRISDGMGGMRVEWTDLDFLIPAADLILPYDSEPLTPRRGDLIHVLMPYDVQTFEVFPFGTEPPWRWADPHQSMYRIHTKLIDLEQFYA